MAAITTIVGNAKLFLVMREEGTGNEYGIAMDIANPFLTRCIDRYETEDITISGTIINETTMDLSRDEHSIEGVTYESVR